MTYEYEKLTYKEDWKDCQKRTKAWWHGEILDRAAIKVIAPRKKVKMEANEKREELTQKDLQNYFTNPERVIEREEKKIANTYWAGEAFPVMFPVSRSMVAVLANYLGCPLKFLNKETTWSEPIAERWDKPPELSFNPENRWWKKSKGLLEKASKKAAGRYYIGIPDLNGPSEILSRIRGAQRLAIDTIRNVNEVKKAIDDITYTWYRYWQAAQGIIHQYVGGYIFMMGIWSEVAAADLQSDFSCVISPEAFDELILPSLHQQTEWIPHTIYHLDGPDAIRHLDSLLSLKNLDGIQWVPGAGAPPTSKWISLLRKIQQAGKLIYVTVEKEEVKIILDKLTPEGLLIN